MKQGLYIHPTCPRIVNGRTSVAVEFFLFFHSSYIFYGFVQNYQWLLLHMYLG